jgi:hypothetical protein
MLGPMRFESFLARRNDADILTNLAYDAWLNFRVAWDCRLSRPISALVYRVPPALAVELAAVLVQVLKRFHSLHAGTG